MGWTLVGWIVLWFFCNNTNAGETSVLTVSATILAKSKCQFNSDNLMLDFGLIDPDITHSVTATTTTGFVCRGSAPQANFLIAHNGGLHANNSTQNRMRHLTLAGEYLPYNLDLGNTAISVKKNTPQTFTVTGRIDNHVLQSAKAGSFQDTVVLSINP